MNKFSRSILKFVLVALWAASGLICFGEGALTTPLQIASAYPIHDERGDLLSGSAEHPLDLVQVLSAADGVIYPPLADGLPDPHNPQVEHGLTAIGALTAFGLGDCGYFGCTLADPRPADGDKIFVRVFNASTLEEATFYADSPIFTVNGNDVFMVDVTKTDKELYPADSDGDGLSDSWEMSYGTDGVASEDFDGDGMRDADEKTAGSDPSNPESIFEVTPAQTRTEWRGEEEVCVLQYTWPSMAGCKYIVSFAESLNDESGFEDVSDVITAVSSSTSYEFDMPASGRGYVVVRAIP